MKKFKTLSEPMKIAYITAAATLGAAIIGAVIGGLFLLRSTAVNPPTPTPNPVIQSPTPIPTSTPNKQATVNAQATGAAEEHAHATAEAQSLLTPQHTLQILCNAAVRADYQTQWNQFDYTYATGNWGNESSYASDLKNRDASHNGVANCIVMNMMQNGISASGVTTTTFGDGTTETILFSLTKQGDSMWRITNLQKE